MVTWGPKLTLPFLAGVTSEVVVEVGAPVPIGWRKVATSDNFRFLRAVAKSPDPLAERIARTAEAARQDALAGWYAIDSASLKWDSRCDVFLYETLPAYRRLTQIDTEISNAGAHLGRCMRGDGHLFLEIHLPVEFEPSLSSTVRHEVMHAVNCFQFAGRRLPTWADEGMACIHEEAECRGRRAEYLRKYLASGQVLSLQGLLMHRGTPDTFEVSAILYAASADVVGMLAELRGRRAFAVFLEDLLRGDTDAALRAHYGMGLDTLAAKWQKRVR